MNVDGLRYSADLDLFSDRIEALSMAVGADVRVLQAAGIVIDWQARGDTFHRAVVSDEPTAPGSTGRVTATTASTRSRPTSASVMRSTQSISRRTSCSPPKVATKCAMPST